jgi:hypothetical protein
VLAAYREGEVIGLLLGRVEERTIEFRIGYWPLLRTRARVWIVFDRGVLVDPTACNPSLFLSHVPKILLDHKIDFVHFGSVPVDSELRSGVMQKAGHGLLWRCEAPERRWWLVLPKSYDEFMKARSKKTRANLRKNEEALKTAHPAVAVQCFTSGDGLVEDAFPQVREVLVKTYQYRLGLSPLCAADAEDLWRRRARLGRLYAVVVRIGDKPVAFSHAEIYKDVAMLITPGYDPAFAELHVGQYAIVRLIEALIQRGDVRLLDYGLGDAQYKQSLGTFFSTEGHIKAYRTCARGRLLHGMSLAFSSVNTGLRRALAVCGLKSALKARLRGTATRA